MEGATFPPTLETEKNLKKQKFLLEHYGIHLHHFLKMQCPLKMQKHFHFETIGRRKSFISN